MYDTTIMRFWIAIRVGHTTQATDSGSQRYASLCSNNYMFDIMIMGAQPTRSGNAVIDLEGSSILIKKVPTRFDMYNVVVKNGGEYVPASKDLGTYHGAITLYGNFSQANSPKSLIQNCTFVDCKGAGIMNENVAETNITFDKNVFSNTSTLGWQTSGGNWIPDGVAIMGYRWGNNGGTEDYATITDNLSFNSTFTKRIDNVNYSGDFWQACINCGGGDQNCRIIDDSYEGVFTGNIMGVDPGFVDPANNDYFATASEASGRGVYNSSSIDEDLLTESVVLSGNYPNPFNPETTINFAIKNSSDVKLTVFNAKGEAVESQLYQNMNAGSNSIQFNGLNLNSGVYFYSIEASNQVKSGKMILVK